MNKPNTPLSDQCVALILGTLLGDGSLSLIEPYKNARLSFRHSVKQREYFSWKVSMLSEISSDKNTWEQSGKNNGYGNNAKLRFQSIALPVLTGIYDLTHKKGKKYVTRKWLNRLTPLSLAAWWCDDGSLISNMRKGVFCTDGYSLKEVEIIQRYLEVVWGINTTLSETTKNDGERVRRYFRLYIRSSEMLKKFLRIIIPHIHVEAMLYKVMPLYNDYKIQQRWISEVAELSKFDIQTIENCIQTRKSSLKKYSEKDIVRSLR